MFTKINYLSNKICTSVLIASSVTRLLSFQKHVQKRYCNQIPYFQGAKKKKEIWYKKKSRKNMCMKRLEMVLLFKKMEDILTLAQHFYSKHSTCKMHSTPRSNKIKTD